MGSSVSSPPALLRRAATAAVAILSLYNGVTFMVTKMTPSGESSNRNIQCWSTSSGGTRMCLRENGTLAVSGSVVANGVTLGGGGGSSFGSGNVLTLGDARYLRRSGGTMTGSLTINVTGGNLGTVGLNVLNTVSGAVIRAQKTLASSGTLVVEGAMSGASLQATTISGTTIRSRYLSPRQVAVEVYGSGANIATGSGKVGIPIPASMSGFNLTNVFFRVYTAGTTNTSNFHIRNVTKGNRKLLSTPASIDSTELTTATAASAYAINSATDDISGNDLLMLDISTVSTTPPKGLVMLLEFSKP